MQKAFSVSEFLGNVKKMQGSDFTGKDCQLASFVLQNTLSHRISKIVDDEREQDSRQISRSSDKY